MISFDVKDPTDGFVGSARLADYKDVKAGKLELLKPIEYVTKLQTLSLVIDYPLTNAAKVTLTTKDPKGFTRLSLFMHVAEAYKKIYDEENQGSKDPEPTGNLYNRPSTKGKYGIWGHCMEDLFLEGAEITKAGKVRLSMGS